MIRDYLDAARRERTMVDVLDELAQIGADRAARPRRRGTGPRLLDGGRSSRRRGEPAGYRLLPKVPRLPGAIVDRLVDHFGGLQKLLAANLDDLMTVEGVGEQRARAVREGLSRLAESSILERYV